MDKQAGRQARARSNCGPSPVRERALALALTLTFVISRATVRFAGRSAFVGSPRVGCSSHGSPYTTRGRSSPRFRRSSRGVCARARVHVASRLSGARRDAVRLVKTPAVLRFRSTIKLIWLSIRLVCIKADGPTTFSRPHWIVVKAGRTSCVRAHAYSSASHRLYCTCTLPVVSSQPVSPKLGKDGGGRGDARSARSLPPLSHAYTRIHTCVHADGRTDAQRAREVFLQKISKRKYLATTRVFFLPPVYR